MNNSYLLDKNIGFAVYYCETYYMAMKEKICVMV